MLAEKDLTFTNAVEIAQGMEVAARDTQLFKSNGGAINKVSQVHKQNGVDKVKLPKPCFRCGKNNHTAVQCKFKDASCCKCQKKGILLLSSNQDRLTQIVGKEVTNQTN